MIKRKIPGPGKENDSISFMVGTWYNSTHEDLESNSFYDFMP